MKLDNSKHGKMCRRNSGYWDGVTDRTNRRLAPWYRGAAKNHGHFDPLYAEGYELGVFGGDAPEGAIITDAELVKMSVSFGKALDDLRKAHDNAGKGRN